MLVEEAALEAGADDVVTQPDFTEVLTAPETFEAVKKAVEAGREAFRAGRIARKFYAATPSSPTSGLIG